MRSLLVALIVTLLTSTLYANTVDTLSSFNPKARYHYYRIGSVAMQAARFEPHSAGELTRISVLLGGLSDTGTARLRLFGNEVGAPVPFLQEDLIAPISLRKTRSGLEWIVVTLPERVKITSHQFFVAIDHLTPGVTLISDGELKAPACAAGAEEFRYQCIKTEDNRWWTGRYGYAIRVEMEPTVDKRWALVDATLDAGFADTTAPNMSLAAADYDNDGNLDILMGGALYRNLGEGQFRNVTATVGLAGLPRANFFIDVNNDGRLDILFLGSYTAATSSAVLFVAADSGRFHRRVMTIPGLEAPTSFSLADADNDGLVDLFVGQGLDSAGAPLPNLLLLNDGKEGFLDRSRLLYADGHPQRASQGSQWVDIDGDRYPDLFVVNQGTDACELWRNNGDATFSIVYGPQGSAPAQLRSSNAVGGHWRDRNHDGRPDLLLLQHTRLASLGGREATSGMVIDLADAATLGLEPVALDKVGIPYSELRGDAAWGDVNNDGELDMLITSGVGCRFADLYLGSRKGKYAHGTADYGLLHLPIGPGGVWVDVNNDGRLDFATFINGRFRLFRNASREVNNFAQIDLGAAHAAGTRVELFAGERRFVEEATSGRGLLMQDPLRLHIGLMDAAAVDSMVIRWPDGRSETVRQVAVNGLTKVHRSAPSSTEEGGALAGIRAYPNPFSDRVTIVFRLAEPRPVRLELFSADGRPAATLIDEKRDAGIHSVVWTAADAGGNPMPQGTYLYRISAGSETMVGTVVLAR